MAQEVPTRLARLALLFGAAALVACGYSGSPAGSGSALSGTTTLSEPISADIAWGPSSGPVDGYRVFEARDGGSFVATQDVGNPQITLTGEEGETLRIQVAGLDAMGAQGPVSEPSDLLRFQDGGVVVEPMTAMASTLGGGGDASTRQVEGVLGSGKIGSSSGQSSADGSSAGTPVDSSVGETDVADDAAPDAVRVDMDGDGATDLLWESASAGLLRVTSAELALLASFERPPAEWALVGLADLDGDGLTDLLWARDTGELAVSSMAGSLASQPTLDFEPAGSLGERDQVAATGDFDGDGTAELLAEDSVSGALSFWSVAPGSTFEPRDLERVVGADEDVAGSADYDGNGFDDVLLRASDGSLTLWLLGSEGLGSEAPIAALPAGDVLASGDFDADGVSDLARSTVAGEVEILLLGSGANSPSSVSGFPAAVAPEAAGAGDYDADGRADLLWQDAQGSPVVWYLEAELPEVDTVGLVAEPDWVLVPDWR